MFGTVWEQIAAASGFRTVKSRGIFPCESANSKKSARRTYDSAEGTVFRYLGRPKAPQAAQKLEYRDVTPVLHLVSDVFSSMRPSHAPARLDPAMVHFECQWALSDLVSGHGCGRGCSAPQQNAQYMASSSDAACDDKATLIPLVDQIGQAMIDDYGAPIFGTALDQRCKDSAAKPCPADNPQIKTLPSITASRTLESRGIIAGDKARSEAARRNYDSAEIHCD